MKSAKVLGSLYLCPVINAMGPVTDPRHHDLLNTWQEIDKYLSKLFDKKYREKFKDSSEGGIIFSWFFISWSGFSSNPVKRDFGYFNVFDHYMNAWGKMIRKYGDGLYWMYNHPPESGVGNEWGMDWLHNCQYLEILMRYVAERNYFPSVVEIVTEDNNTSHFLENFFPYDLGNRNSVDVNWDAVNADGKPMWKVINWKNATHNWEIYSPHEDDHQLKGNMKRKIGRLLDIKTIVYEFKEYELEKAFQMCLEGKDAMVSAYEHDFRDRADVIIEKFIEPAYRISKKYPEVKWYYKNVLDAFNILNNQKNVKKVKVEIKFDRDDNLLILTDSKIFGLPFTFLKLEDHYTYITPLRVGEKAWLIYRELLDFKSDLYIACNNLAGKSTIKRISLRNLHGIKHQ